mgnify:CR=1 FL=1
MDNKIYYTVGFKNKIMKACSNGTYDFAIRTAKYYRSIGYNARIMTVEEFEQINE